MKGERDEQTEHHPAGHAAAVVGHWRNGGDGLLGLVSAESILARIIHERFCCNRGFAAATSLSAGGLAARSVDILFKDAFLPHGSARPSRCATPHFRDEPS